MRRALKREAIITARFGLVGLASTTVHIAIVRVALMVTDLTALAANTLAFFLALGVSYAGNYLWTFGSPGNPRRALLRFFTIAVFALSVNSLMLALLTHYSWLDPLTAATISAAVIPLISYLFSKLWVFERSERPLK